MIIIVHLIDLVRSLNFWYNKIGIIIETIGIRKSVKPTPHEYQYGPIIPNIISTMIDAIIIMIPESIVIYI